MANRFDVMLKNTAANLAKDSAVSLQWFKDKVDETTGRKRTDPNHMFQRSGTPQIGKMFLFYYDAKYKNTLPFFDKHPLVFPIEMYGDGFLGINLHYLPPLARVSLLRSLDIIKNNDKYNDTTKLVVSYKTLKAFATQFAGYDQCIKRYLYGHVKSSFHEVYPADWEKAAMLPLQNWSINKNRRYSGSPPY